MPASHRHEDVADPLDEVLAEIERARREPTWVPEEPRRPRRLLSTPEPLDEARWMPSRPAVVVLAALAFLALAIFGARVFLSRQPDAVSAAPASVKGTASLPDAPRSASSARSAPSPPATAGPGGASATSGPWSVHVVGAVASPGVVTVQPGARVADAIEAAGGLTKQADTRAVNLARAVADGEQIIVLKPGESPPAASSVPVPPATAPVPESTLTASGSASPGTQQQVDLNSADLAALDSLPGVGPVLAQRIIDWRTEHGRFSSVDELGEVSGIGDKVLERLRPKVRV